jgi:hypothetical protein
VIVAGSAKLIAAGSAKLIAEAVGSRLAPDLT